MPVLFTTPVEPKFIATEFLIEKMGVFTSAKSPLLIVLGNSDDGGANHRIMFKNGDDLRQDILTLQMIDIMDRIWLDNDLDLAMTPYKVVLTDCMQGYLEFNLNSVTLADIQHKDLKSLYHTFSDTSVHDFFVEEIIKVILETDSKSKQPKFQAYRQFDKPMTRIDYVKALAEIKDEDAKRLEEPKRSEKKRADEFYKIFVERLEKIRNVFIRSTAGYCVASYVLGLGDRHPDNIMINRFEGNFFHIDFGHFLENKKLMPVVKISREQDPFVFTPEIAYFVNGQSFKESKKQNK